MLGHSVEDNNRSNVRNERGAALNEHTMRWIVDINLPQVRINNPDVLPLENLTGDLFLQAHITNRYIVSADIEKVINKMPSLNTNTIAVLFDEENITIEGLIRNLVHFEFCMQTRVRAKHTPKWDVFCVNTVLGVKYEILGVQCPYFADNRA